MLAKHGCARQPVPLIPKREGISLDKAAAKKLQADFNRLQLLVLKGEILDIFTEAFEFIARHFPYGGVLSASVKVHCYSN